MSLRVRASWSLWAISVVAIMVVAVVLVPAPADSQGFGFPFGFMTPQEPFITLAPDAPPGSRLKPIISSGERLGNGFRFQGIPDGIGIAPGPSKHTVNVFVAHEQSTVPFSGFRDFQDASVSKLTISRLTGRVLRGSVALSPNNG